MCLLAVLYAGSLGSHTLRNLFQPFPARAARAHQKPQFLRPFHKTFRRDQTARSLYDRIIGLYTLAGKRTAHNDFPIFVRKPACHSKDVPYAHPDGHILKDSDQICISSQLSCNSHILVYERFFQIYSFLYPAGRFCIDYDRVSIKRECIYAEQRTCHFSYNSSLFSHRIHIR